MARSTAENATRARVGAERTEFEPESIGSPERASGADVTLRRPTVDTLTDDELDSLYAERDRLRVERDTARRIAVALENELACADK